MEKEPRRTKKNITKIAPIVLLASLAAGGCTDIRSKYGAECNPRVNTQYFATDGDQPTKHHAIKGKDFSEPALDILRIEPLPHYKSTYEQGFEMEKKQGVLKKPNLVDTNHMKNANVSIVIRTPDKKDRFCNGVHKGRGKIATAWHCFEGYLPKDLTVTVFDANNKEHPGTSVSYIPGIDAAIVRTDDSSYPGKSELSSTHRLAKNSYISMYSTEQDGSASHNVLYLGGYLKFGAHNCNDSDKYHFLSFADTNRAKHGHSGSGMYDKNGKLIGIFTDIIRAPEELLQPLVAVRADVIEKIK